MSIKPKDVLAVLTIVSLSILVFACNHGQKEPPIDSGNEVNGAVVSLDQGWTTEIQQAYYFTDQGSRVIPYSWFLALEQVDNQELFRSNANVDSYRYLPAAKSDLNPDALPVGFVKNIDPKTKDEWVGFTCAACHTGQISYKNVQMRIDGGPALADFESFNADMLAALIVTYEQQDKFDRFASAVLGNNASTSQIAELREQLLTQTDLLDSRFLLNRPTEDQPNWGYARLDGIGAILNQILADFNGLSTTGGQAADAPTSYPFIWGTPQSDVVQWTGFTPNGPTSYGHIIRNGVEVLGVYGQLDIPNDTDAKYYSSSINIKNLGELEKWAGELRSPVWPAEYFPPIDSALAAKGSEHYQELCIDCHQVIPREEEGKSYRSVLTPLSEVGTDSTELDNMVRPRAAGKYAGRKTFVIAGPVIGEQTSVFGPLLNAVSGAMLEHPEESIAAAAAGVSTIELNADGSGYRPVTPPTFKEAILKHAEIYETVFTKRLEAAAAGEGQGENFLVYKARPLNGIWATAPFLHNGSVPNLFELLLPVAERSKEFYLGSYEYDPVKVGFDSEASKQGSKAFKFDTRLKGNSNSGHEYGAELSETERKELLEYLKSI